MNMKDKKLELVTKGFLSATTFLIPFYFLRFSVSGIPTNIFEIAVLISLIVFIASGRVSKSNYRDWLMPLLLTIVAAFSVVYSDDKERALGIVKGWFLVPVIFGWLISNTFSKQNIKKLIWPVFISLLVVSLWAILQKLGTVGLNFYQQNQDFDQYFIQGRAFGPFESPNYLAMFIVPTFLLSLYLLEPLKNIFKKIPFALLYILPLLALLLTHSRAGELAMVIALLFYINYRFINTQKGTKRKSFGWLFFIALLIGVNIAALVVFSKTERLDSGSDTARRSIYAYAGTMLKQNYLTGIGLGDFHDKITVMSKGDKYFTDNVLPYALHPHNLLLAIWLNMGIVGLIVFLWFIAIYYIKCFRTDPPMVAILFSAMLAILLHGLFDTTYFKNDLAAIFWLLFALTIIFSVKNDQEAN
jgi:O-antigen ligase